MRGPSSAQVDRVKRLLAHEGASEGSSVACAHAAVRVYDKLSARLIPLLGSAGVQALFGRAAKVSAREWPGLGADVLESSVKFGATLQAQDPAAAVEAAETLLGTFFLLITTFIGERLTLQVLRSAWPAIDEPAPTENNK